MKQDSKIIRFINCNILREHKIIREDLWVRNGKIVNPEPIFFEEKRIADIVIECSGMLIAPGYIDIQINGGFGYDFSNPNIDLKDALQKTAKGMLKYGVTAFCPTLVTSPPECYHKILPQLKRTVGNKEIGATNLGVHLEGPFISNEKRGAHPTKYIKGESIDSYDDIQNMYKYLEDVSIITIAPELDKTGDIIRQLANRGIVVSVGHSIGTLCDGERAVNNGANFITHLFNAMLPFHHRDPGLIGLITSNTKPKPNIFYGIIADGIHTHYTALKIAFKSNHDGLVLVTDAISATGLDSGTHRIGTQEVDIVDNKAYIAGTKILCGSIATLDFCVRNFRQETNCSVVDAIECATLHPSQVLRIERNKGTLNFGADADLIFLDEELNVFATFISGECVYKRDEMINLTV